MGVDACGRPTEVPDNYNIGADGAPGETSDFLLLLSHVPGGLWDAARSAAQGVGSAASNAWAFANLDDDEQGRRLGRAVDGGVATAREAAAQTWNHPGETLRAAADHAKASIDSLGNTCPSDAGHALGGLTFDYATGKAVQSTVAKVAGLAGDVAADGAKPAATALAAPKSDLATAASADGTAVAGSPVEGTKDASAVTGLRQTPPIEEGKQGKHVRGHNNFDPARSELTDDPQKLANQYAGKGQPITDSPRGTPGFKERFTADHVIGMFRDKAGNSEPSQNGVIVYSSRGIHIYPGKP